MRLAVLTPGYSPDPGGVESVVTAVCEGLAERGVDIEVWTHGVTAERVVTNGVRVTRFRTNRSHRFPLAPGLWRHAARHAHRFDLVHAHSFHASAALGALFSPPTTPVVFTPHYHGGGHTLTARLVHLPYRPIAARLFHRADLVITVSRAERQLLLQGHPALAPRVTTVHNAVDVAGIHSARPFDEGPPLALVLGRLEPYKRVDVVIEAFQRLKSPGRLVIVGEGPDRRRLTELADRGARAGDVIFTGRIDRVEVERWLRTASCVVSMSEQEAFGIVGLEGVAAGAQVLLSDLPAHREVAQLVGPRNARIIPRRALSDALASSLASPRGEPRLVRDWSAVVEEHLLLYRTLFEPPQTRHQHAAQPRPRLRRAR